MNAHRTDEFFETKMCFGGLNTSELIGRKPRRFKRAEN